MSPIAVRCQGLTKDFGPVRAVEGLSLTVERGQTLVLLGPSGCGKTSVLRLIAGFEVPDEGTVEIGGRVVAGPGVLVPPERRQVGMVFQDYALFPHLMVEENIAFGLRRLPPSQRRNRTWEILFLIGMEGLRKRYPHQLSGGQQQRIALGRALAPQPQVLLLDEPFSNLDADLRLQMREEVRHILKDTATTAIFVTHDQGEGFSLADRLAVLNQGRLEQLDDPETVYSFPATRFVADFVGHADFLPGRVGDGVVKTELGDFPYESPLPPGAEVEVMVRPENLRLALDPQGAATAVERRFLGASIQYTLRLTSGVDLHASTPSAELYPAGSRLQVEVRLPCLTVFPRLPRHPTPGSSAIPLSLDGRGSG